MFHVVTKKWCTRSDGAAGNIVYILRNALIVLKNSEFKNKIKKRVIQLKVKLPF